MAKLLNSNDSILQKLKDHGLKSTQARVRILALLTQKHGPFSADEVYKLLSSGRNAESIDRVTVYRCLAKFEELSLVATCDFGDGTTRYEMKHEDHHHHHIICRRCKRVEEVSLCPMDDLEFRMPKTGFKDVTHRLEFFGICPECIK